MDSGAEGVFFCLEWNEEVDVLICFERLNVAKRVLFFMGVKLFSWVGGNRVLRRDQREGVWLKETGEFLLWFLLMFKSDLE